MGKERESSKNAKRDAGLTLTDKVSGASWELQTPTKADGKSLAQATSVLYEVPITNNTIPAVKFKEMSADPRPGSREEDESTKGLRVYDPAFQNTAVCYSKITYINGDLGILRYRGYPIEQLAEKSTYLEVAYLLIYGELPSKEQHDSFVHEVMHHTFVHFNVAELMRNFNYDAHPMGMFLSGISALSTFHPDANPALAGSNLFIRNETVRNKQILRLLGKTPTLAAAVAGAAAALYGPLHGGANEAVLRMLEEIGSTEKVPLFLNEVKERKRKLFGFGHRVYKSYDPRAKIIRKIAYEVFEVCGRESLIDVAIELEKRALEDEYFVKRQLYPNVDFYSGLIYKAMGFPTDMFPVLFAIPRVAGWLAHWKESLEDKEAKIWRPRQVYVGPGVRSYIPMELRESSDKNVIKID
ncbi:11143_t:CDS:10 [Acaulospora colombiana]|uniref:11143_t:CDS:1 n=1 Tax=Acaulospora colombiana TaxID=27376 RepID=A0ACA9L6R1_9GLOM|nr:11143_t:CDS:10 [Acaulospora colombiana]